MPSQKKVEHKLKYSLRLIKNEGIVAFLISVLQKYQNHRHKVSLQKRPIVMLVDSSDVLGAENTVKQLKSGVNKEEIIKLAWVMSPPGASGGGHQNIFRFIKHLDDNGFHNYIYLYSTNDYPETTEIKERIKGFYDLDLKNIKWLNAGENIENVDAIVATGWETAYPVRNSTYPVKKFYFVQDFEPYFYPIGSEYVLAENTYKFGFIGITAGGWLSKKLNSEYGMKCYSYSFASESGLYKYKNNDKRNEVFFYARPITTRRGFELGLIALKKFHDLNPEYTINLAGWDVSEYEIPFPYVNHKALNLNELSDLYNRCSAGLVISLTNLSLLPLELLSCGTIPVVNDGENNRLVSTNQYIKYTEATPNALAKAMDEVVNANDCIEISKKAAKSVENISWHESLVRVENILKDELYV